MRLENCSKPESTDSNRHGREFQSETQTLLRQLCGEKQEHQGQYTLPALTLSDEGARGSYVRQRFAEMDQRERDPLYQLGKGMEAMAGELAKAPERAVQALSQTAESAGNTIIEALTAAHAHSSDLAYPAGPERVQPDERTSPLRALSNMWSAPKGPVQYSGHGGFEIGRFSRRSGQ